MNKAMLLEKIAAIFSIAFLAACVLVWLTGCMAIAGIKEAGSNRDGWYVKAITGVDAGVEMRGLDTVDDRKGINAGGIKKGN